MLSDVPMLLRRHCYGLVATGIIACAIALRFALTIIGWPHHGSEEGTMGLEAMHILMRGEHPIYFYGQNYMGVPEAYAGALSFRLFGISTISLRLGMIAFYAVFLICLYWMARRLYSHRVALISLVILSLGTPFLVQIELLADGGKVETLAFGALMYAAASWLALSRPISTLTPRQRWLRYAAFATWGLAAGLGLYTYSIIAPFVLTSGLLLAVTCWREIRGWALLFTVAGLLIGLFPVIIYTATMPLKDNPISVFLSLHNSLSAGYGPKGWHLLVKQIEGTLLYTLPTVTGLVLPYPATAMPFYGPLRFSTITSLIIGGGWSLGYLSLLSIATYHPSSILRKQWIAHQQSRTSGANIQDSSGSTLTHSLFASQDGARAVAQLMLALTAWLTIAVYMSSPTAANNVYSGRYMIGLLLVWPAVLWPLIGGLRNLWIPSAMQANWKMLRRVWRPAVLLFLAMSLITGMVAIVQAVPATVALNQQDARFAHDLLDKGITRFYSDYWTCDLLAFNTQEKLTCGVVTLYAQPGRIRYARYYAEVQADPHAPYVFVRGSDMEQTFVVHIAETGQKYSVEYLDSYSVYTPIPAPQ